jgi:hemerythrin
MCEDCAPQRLAAAGKRAAFYCRIAQNTRLHREREMTDSFSLQLGDPALDQDHAELLRLIHRLRDAAPSEALPALDELRAHAARHFEVEDADLRRQRDGNAQCHLDEHAAVLKSLGEVREILAAPAPLTEARQSMLPRLVAELTRWLPEHVQAMDAAVASFRTKERLGGAPVVMSRKPASGE